MTVLLPKACVFDLDGTLVNSLADIAEAFNECLEVLGLPTHPIEKYRYMVGEGIPKLCERAVGDTHPHLCYRLAELARARYQTRILAKTQPYDGIRELIGRLCAKSVKLAVLSNKPHAMTVRIVRAFWPNGEFLHVLGYKLEAYRKPDPTGLLEICEKLGVVPTDTWMIGDTATDVETARRAGVRSVGVTWGFRPIEHLQEAGADRIIHCPNELL